MCGIDQTSALAAAERVVLIFVPARRALCEELPCRIRDSTRGLPRRESRSPVPVVGNLPSRVVGAPHESTHNFSGCQRMLTDSTKQEDMKKARFYAGFIHLLDFLGRYKIIKWWRRRELNPRPETVRQEPLHA